MPYTKPGTSPAPNRLTAMASQGAAPTTVPNQNGTIVVETRPGGFDLSCTQPNRIIATLAPAMAIMAVMSVMPL
jgi:hypothetical protein